MALNTVSARNPNCQPVTSTASIPSLVTAELWQAECQGRQAWHFRLTTVFSTCQSSETNMAGHIFTHFTYNTLMLPQPPQTSTIAECLAAILALLQTILRPPQQTRLPNPVVTGTAYLPLLRPLKDLNHR